MGKHRGSPSLCSRWVLLSVKGEVANGVCRNTGNYRKNIPFIFLCCARQPGCTILVTS